MNSHVDARPRGPVIDCDVFIGQRAGSSPVQGADFTTDQLIATMDRCGVDLAVVYHIVALEHAPVIGNELLLEQVRGNPRLIPAFVLLPPHTRELPPIDEVIARMRAEGARMARIFPSSELAGHRFALREWCVGPLLTALEDAAIPLGVDFTLFRRGEPPWDDIYEICRHHPDLRVALMDVQGRNNRTLYALLERFPHLYLSTSGLNVHTGVEDVAARFGADRLFLGSGAPTRSMGAARLVVDRAGIDDAQRETILTGCAASLLALTSGRV